MSQLHAGSVVASVDGRDVIECELCRLRHVWPYPSATASDELYKHQYHDDANLAFAKQQEQDRAWWECTLGDRLDVVEQQLGRRGRLLDIGSGTGMFIDVASKRGWDCVGLEPSVRACEYSRSKGHKVIESFWTSEIASTVGVFDLVHLANVLEHVVDPHAILSIAAYVLGQNGFLIASVPNDFNPLQTAFVQSTVLPQWWVVPDHHINYFSLPSLKLLIERSGLEVFYTHSSFPLELFLLMGDNYIGDSDVGRKCHERRMNFDLCLSKFHKRFKLEFYRQLGGMGIGRDIVVYARNPSQ
jgi:SAM-dependent methyltransferase